MRDVQACVRWAARHRVPLGVRSGGHSTAGQSSTTGLLVDLRRLSSVAVSGGRARVGGGALLGHVYDALWAAGGRAIPAGTAPSVGLSGLALAGGHGFLTRRYGLTCDSVLAAELVTADGRLRRCTPAHEPDLLWALRGGGGSFGIVTALELRTVRPGTVTTVALRWPWAQAADVVAAWTTFVAAAPATLSCVLALRAPDAPGGTPTIALNGLVTGMRAQAQMALEPLVTATSPSSSAYRERTWDVAVRYFAGGQSNARHGIAAASGYARAPLTAAGRTALVDVVAARAEAGLARGGAVLFALGGAVDDVAPAATAWVHRGARFSVELLALWDAPSEQQGNVAWVNDARRATRPFLSGQAAQSYADPALPAARRAYYGANLERLVRIKRRVDPADVFRRPQGIPVRL